MFKPLADVFDSSEETKSERIHKDLRRRIREFELLPGSRLRKNEIALGYGVSRAPVSAAIARLADEGLVDVFPQRGSFVAPIRPRDIRESMLIRMGLEIEAIRRITVKPSDKLLQQIEENLAAQEDAIRKHNMPLLDELDESFHATIFTAVDSPRAQHMLDTARALLDRPRFHALPEAGRPMITFQEHRRIADAISMGDVELAAAAMRAHLTMVARAIEQELVLLEVS